MKRFSRVHKLFCQRPSRNDESPRLCQHVDQDRRRRRRRQHIICICRHCGRRNYWPHSVQHDHVSIWRVGMTAKAFKSKYSTLKFFCARIALTCVYASVSRVCTRLWIRVPGSALLQRAHTRKEELQRLFAKEFVNSTEAALNLGKRRALNRQGYAPLGGISCTDNL